MKPASTWNSVPAGVDRWTQLNAGAALLGVLVSLACDILTPVLIVAAVAMGWLYWRHAPPGLGVANLVTAMRLWLLGGVLSFALPGHWIAITAGVVYALDGLDGWIARQRNEVSAFGAQFDMETDSYLMLLLGVYLVIEGGMPPWILATGALRYVYVLVRWMAGPGELRERRTSWGRWVYSLVFMSLAVACVPGWKAITGPLLALASLLLASAFVPDFLALRRRSPASTYAPP